MLFSTIFVIEFSLVTSELLFKGNVKRGYSDDLNTLTNEILLYMKNAQLTKAWWPTWTVTPINYTPQIHVGRVGPSSMLLPGHQPASDIDSEVEDYKQVLDPNYQKKTRSTTAPIESTVTTTSTYTTTTTPRTTTTTTPPSTTTSESPIAQELDEYIEKKHVGMFSAFTIKFLKILTHKKPEEVKPLLDVFNLYIAILISDERINRIPDKTIANELKKYLDSFSLFLKYASTENIQQRGAIFIKKVEEQHDNHLTSEYSIYNFLDKFFDTKDAPAMLKALEDMDKYPGNGMSATDVVGKLNAVILMPLEQFSRGYMKMRVHSSSSNLKENVIDKNEAKVLTNGWDYKKYILFNTYSNYNENKATSSAGYVKPANNTTKFNNEILKSNKVQDKNVIFKNNYYISNNLNVDTNRSVSVVRKVTEFNNKNISEKIKGEDARKTYNKKVSDAKNNKFNEIKLVSHKQELRRKMAYTINGIQQNKKRNYLKKGHSNREEKWQHRLNYHFYESSLKSDKNKRKLYKNFDTTQYTIIKSDELDIQNNLFLTTHNTRRNNQNKTSKRSLENMKAKNVTKKVKVDTRSIKEKLFEVLKGKDGRKFFTTTTRKGLGEVSSESDEEIELRMNIYKAIGVNDDFNRVKVY